MTQWKLTGTYFETCNCDAACPCVFGSMPTEGVCHAIVAWHIKHGTFSDVVLDGLNVALLGGCARQYGREQMEGGRLCG
ncbi:MAG: DUF1326 domain-containing protein [Methylovirgula sp.]